MQVKAAQGLARILKSEGVPWVACYPTNHVNNALGEEDVPILMMREERYAVAVADAFSRHRGKQVGVCTIMGGLNAAGIQLAYGAVAQAFEDSSPVLVITGGAAGSGGHTHYDMVRGFQSVTKWVGTVDKAELMPDFAHRAFTQLRSGRPGPVLLIVPPNLGEYDEDAHPYTPVKGWRSAPDPDDVKAAVQALLRAQSPLLYVGEGVFYAQAMDELQQFAELAQVPVLTTLKGKSAFRRTMPSPWVSVVHWPSTFCTSATCCLPSAPASFPIASATPSRTRARRPSSNARSTPWTFTAATRPTMP